MVVVANSLRENFAPHRAVGDGTIFSGIEGVFFSILQAANVVAVYFLGIPSQKCL